MEHLAEYELRERLAAIVDSSDDAIISKILDGTISAWNRGAEKVFGYSAAEMVGKPMLVLLPPERIDEESDILARIKRGESVDHFETVRVRKGGTKIDVSVTILPIRDSRGVIVGASKIARDITERKRAEEALREIQAQKLASVGQLAAGIAHEINTPTQYIGDNVCFLKKSFQEVISLLGSYEGLLVAANANTLTNQTVLEVTAAVERADLEYLVQEIPKSIDQSLEGIARVSTLVNAMKEFSHPGTKEKTPLDLNHAIESTITVASNEWKYVADLETDFDPLLPLVSCLPGEFNQVILNLIVNAAHAIADTLGKGGIEKGKITVRTRNYPMWAEIQIADTGCGIPKEVRLRIFDPFFTTKEIGKGTGLGLAIARSVVVDKHGGSIDFETGEGSGTTFIIRLPHDVKRPVPGAAAA